MVEFTKKEWLPARIRNVVEGRGFCFAELADGRPVFIHLNSLRGGLIFGPGLRGQVVRLVVEQESRGWRAVETQPADEEDFAGITQQSDICGTVVRVVETRKFGFIRPDEGEDAFFHASDLADGLEFDARLQERRVIFDIVPGAKGPRAMNIRPARVTLPATASMGEK